MDPRSTPITFRARRIPPRVTKQSLPLFLQNLSPDLGEAGDIRVRSLAPALEDFSFDPRQTATLEFSHLPRCLRDKDRLEWSFPIEDSDDRILLDKSFFGFTPLNSVEPRTHEFDCIAVSGLGSHPFGSWRQRGSAMNSQFMWLRDQLPIDVPSLKVIIYGYDTRITGSESFQDVDDLATSFITHLGAIGRADFSAKPLILLAHSLGGIVVKKALYDLARGGEMQRLILDKIKLLIFFGVPNKGMHTEHLLAMAKGQPNTPLIQTLSTNSTYLEQLDQRLAGTMIYRRIRIVSAYETMLSPTAERQASGEWKRTGQAKVLVSRGSAIQSASLDPQDIFSIDQDHSNMVKFSPDDISYLAVRSFIYELLRHHYGRGPQGPSTNSSSHPFMGQYVESQQPPVSRSQTGGPQYSDTQSEAQRDRLRQERRAYLPEMKASLAFTEQNFRIEAIKPAHVSTFQWIFENERLGLMDWILRGEGLYWIRGKPGSGKSTFMKFLHDHPDLGDALHYRGFNMPQLDLWFFFNERGSSLQKSLEGLMRTILLQIATRDERLADLMLEVYLSSESMPRRRSWTLASLNEAFKAILQQTSYEVTLLLFLDALDEYQGRPEVIAQWLVDLASASASSRRTRIKICFSSRPWDAFVKAFDACLGFKIHEHTHEDLKAYAHWRLQQKQREQHHSDGVAGTWARVPAHKFVELISRKAEGVFLWVKLALDESFASPAPSNLEALSSLIDGIPTELEEFYLRAIHRIPYYSRKKVYTLLELVYRSIDIAWLEELLAAASCAHGATYGECKDLLRVRPKLSEEESARNLANLCGGLLECIFSQPSEVSHYTYPPSHYITPPTKRYVQFIHRTVRDFMGRPGSAQTLLGPQYTLQIDNGYCFWMKYRILALGEGNPDTRLLYFAHHDELTTGRPATEFLGSLPPELFQGGSKRLESYRSVFEFAVLADLRLFVQSLIADSIASSPRTIPPQERPLNLAALAARLRYIPEGKDWSIAGAIDLTKMCEILINHGFKADVEHYGLTAFQCLFANVRTSNPYIYGHSHEAVEIARLLITRGGQDPNQCLTGVKYTSRQGDAFTAKPTSWRAIHVGCTGDMLLLLLNHGANPNLRGHSGQVALDRYCEARTSGHIVYGPSGTRTRNPQVISDIETLLRHGACITRHYGKDAWPKFIHYLSFEFTNLPDEIKKPPILPSRPVQWVKKVSGLVSRPVQQQEESQEHEDALDA